MPDETQNRNGSDRERVNGKFAPGVSGNPGGRPKGIAAAVRDAYPANEIVAGMVKIAKGLKVAGQKPTISDMVRAREWLADRGYGKAAAFAALEGGDPLELGAVDEAIAGVVDELAVRREAATPERPADGTLDAGQARSADTAAG